MLLRASRNLQQARRNEANIAAGRRHCRRQLALASAPLGLTDIAAPKLNYALDCRLVRDVSVVHALNSETRSLTLSRYSSSICLQLRQHQKTVGGAICD